jgi:hypothetical protein
VPNEGTAFRNQLERSHPPGVDVLTEVWAFSCTAYCGIEFNFAARKEVSQTKVGRLEHDLAVEIMVNDEESNSLFAAQPASTSAYNRQQGKFTTALMLQ